MEAFEEEGKQSRRIMLFNRIERKRLRRIQKMEHRDRDIDTNRRYHEKFRLDKDIMFH
jgi:hypothetical protein